jgi:hypothetical protein
MADEICFDLEIKPREILELSSPDGIAAFFSRLGYHTDSRLEQTAENLGITSEAVAKPIERIELVADEDGLLQVYLFELASVTVTHTKNLVRSFRNKTGDYLLVLTSDYERIDFVLVERFIPHTGEKFGGLGQPQIGVRPRILSVDRRNPTPVQIPAC